MYDEVNVLKTQMLNQGLKVLNMIFQAIGIVLGLVRKSASHVIRDNDSISISQSADQVAIIEGPGWIAMDQEHHGPLAFIEVMQLKIA